MWGVTCWFSWFEKVENAGNKISSAFLSVNQHKKGRGSSSGCCQLFVLSTAALSGASAQQQSHSLREGDDCGNYMALGSLEDSDSQNGFLSGELKARCELGKISLSSPLFSGYCLIPEVSGCLRGLQWWGTQVTVRHVSVAFALPLLNSLCLVCENTGQTGL